MNGTIDLSKAQINIVLHADPSKIPAHQVPNELVGVGKTKTDLNGAKMVGRPERGELPTAVPATHPNDR